jgi:chromatin remodeling complex protein RSC6
MAKVKKEDKPTTETNEANSVAIKQETPDGSASVETPSNEALKQLIVKLVPQVDLNRTGVKQFTKKLAAELGGGTATLKNLQSRSEFIKETLSEVINAMEEEDDDDDDEPILQAVSKKNSGDASSSATNKAGKAKKPFKSNLATKAELSEALSNFLGKGKSMARTEIVRELWDYIKIHQLQNPENKREIILDERMKEVFGVDTFTMFTMVSKCLCAYWLSYHMHYLCDKSLVFVSVHQEQVHWSACLSVQACRPNCEHVHQTKQVR